MAHPNLPTITRRSFIVQAGVAAGAALAAAQPDCRGQQTRSGKLQLKLTRF